jgi:hypothetical protein
MYRLKIFASVDDHNDLRIFENRINVWLNQIDPLIHLMGQSAHSNGLVITFVYEIPQRPEDKEPATTETTVPAIFQEELDQTILDPEHWPPSPTEGPSRPA